MIYKKFQNLELSWLGYGAMRLPVTEQRGPIDEEKAMELIDCAYKNGVNFFDTAYFYHAGESQKFIGKALSRYPRNTWYLSNKLPGNLMERVDGGIRVESSVFGLADTVYTGAAEIFEAQLKNCGVDYFDFYMLHNLDEATYELYTDEKLGFTDYLLEQKKAGRIRHLGFSAHGRPEIIEKFLSERDCFEFALIQLNYLDWHIQEAGRKYEILTKHGIPVFIMEPVRGGKLAAPGKEAEEMLKAARPGDTPASWAFRFIQSLPNVAVVVSGMTTMEQIKENIEIFGRNDPVTESEKALLNSVVETLAELVPCTGCRYCCDPCPQKLEIPTLLSMYNETGYESSWSVNQMLELMNDAEKPQACVKCGVCNPLCPQNIDIPDALSKFRDLLDSRK
ncbi:MAG: aldo/keto reductase [Defluviitaleaceae bacterium]|nr:aldo/keto reductase [Defluviitaleaceae bacterium]MCL2835685.1 aldo/keto reductase [Defluviitaleaceae bacterium]